MAEENVFNIQDILNRVRAIEQNSPDIEDLLRDAEKGNNESREKLIESLIPLSYKYVQRQIHLLCGKLNINYVTIQQYQEDMLSEGMLALVETVNMAIARKSGIKWLMQTLSRQVSARISQFFRTVIFHEQKEVAASNVGREEQNTIVSGYSDQTDNDVDQDIIMLLIKDEIVKILAKYKNQEDVQLLYAYVGLHTLTFTELIEQEGISRKEAIKRIKLLMEWFRDTADLI